MREDCPYLMMDDDWILSEIERQLSAISDKDLDDNFYEDVDDDSDTTSDSNNNTTDDDKLPDSLLQYSQLSESHLKQFADNLHECDDVLQESVRVMAPRIELLSPTLKEPQEDSLARVSGLTNSAMNTSQDNECIVVKTPTETEQHFSDDDIQDIEMSPTDRTNGDTSDTSDTIVTEQHFNDVYDSEALEQKMDADLQVWEDTWNHNMNVKLQQDVNDVKQREIEWEELDEQRHRQAHKELEQQEKDLLLLKQEQELKMQEELQQIENEMKELLENHKKEIHVIETQSAHEKKELETVKQTELQALIKKQHTSAVKIQAFVKGSRTRKQYQKILKEKIKTAEEKKIEKRLKELEEQKEKEKVELLQQEKEERHRLERVKLEEEKMQRLEQEKLELEEKEKERLHNEAKEKERLKQEQIEREERQKMEREKLEQERLEIERLEQKRVEKEKSEQQKILQERMEEERLMQQEIEQKKLNEQILEKQRAEKLKQERLEMEKLEREQERRKIEEQEGREREEQEKILKEEQQRKEKDEREVRLDVKTTKTQGNITLLNTTIDSRRMAWMKSCTSWSNIVANKKSKMKGARKSLRRPMSSKHVSTIPNEVIISAAHVQSLAQVCSVELTDLPGYSLSPLSACTHLTCIVIKNSACVSLDGLEKCQKLKYLDASSNSIETLNLRDLCDLSYVDLANNKLSSSLGLEGCANLQYLDLSHNRITRLGGLGSFSSLHTINLSYNQLIALTAIDETWTIQHLDISHNHLSTIDNIQHLALLRYFNASHNNISQIMPFTNHVILLELLLSNNAISETLFLQQSWLPCLKQLDLSENSIADICCLSHLLTLDNLNLSSNQLLECQSLCANLKNCDRLQRLDIDGNPLAEEQNIRSSLCQTIISLRILDGEKVNEFESKKSEIDFVVLCQTQNYMEEKLCENYKQALSKQATTESKCAVHKDYHNKHTELSVLSRYAHEYGSSDEITEAMITMKSVDVNLSQQIGHKHTGNLSDDIASLLTKEELGSNVESEYPPLADEESNLEDERLMAEYQAFIEDLNSRYCETHHHSAAIKIQALFRGHLLRSRLQKALQYARYDLDTSDTEEMDMMEIDLDHFDMDMDNLEKAWLPPSTPQLPTRGPVLSNPASNNIPDVQDCSFAHPEPHVPPLALYDHTSLPPSYPQPPSVPKKAWHMGESPGLHPHPPSHPNPNPTPPPASQMSDISSQAHTIQTARTQLSKKEDKITEEWGFKDSSTAALMMRRAKKLKYNAERKEKLKKLDPKQRLALFRKLEETSPAGGAVHMPNRKAVIKKEYFQARSEQQRWTQQNNKAEEHNKQQHMYEWLHTQMGEHSVVTDRNKHTEIIRNKSSGALPQMDASVLAGKRAQFMGSPDPSDLLTYKTTSDKSHRRYSLHNGPTGRPVQFPPIQTSSAPSSATKKPEKMSWRNPSTMSGGWGGGRKIIRPK